MKRKIYHTPHGRVIMKMQPAVDGKHKLLIRIRLHNHLTCFPIRVAQIFGIVDISGIRNRRRLQKLFKRFDQNMAEQFASDCYQDVPAVYRREVE